MVAGAGEDCAFSIVLSLITFKGNFLFLAVSVNDVVT
jgi:hypothetical protein